MARCLVWHAFDRFETPKSLIRPIVDNRGMQNPDNSNAANNPQDNSAVNPQKTRTGFNRIFHAGGYSIEGMKAGWGETAFRQEAIAAIFLVPMAFWLGENWVETALLAGTVLVVMIVELLNTGIETAIDRIGPEWHALSKRAKDMGSAAVLLSLLLCGGVWSAALLQRFCF